MELQVRCHEIKQYHHHQQQEHYKQPTNLPNGKAANDKNHFLLLQYKREIGDNIVISMKKTVLILLPETIHTQIVYTGRKLCTYFQIKGKSKFDLLHDLVYHAKYPCELSNENYIGE